MTSSGSIAWTNDRRKLRELVPWERNPRQIRKEQAGRLADSLDEFGQVQAIAIGPDNEIYDGHQRKNVWAALDRYGPDYEVDVRVASRPLTEKEREMLVVYLHRGAHGEWDFDILANEFEVDDLLEWGFDEVELGLIGFDPGEDEGGASEKAPLQEIEIPRGDLISFITAHKRIYIAFSGGKDSMAVALWYRERTANPATLVYYNTGIGWPEEIAVVRAFGEQFDFSTQIIGYPDDSVWRKGLIEYGMPSFAGSMWCQDRLKKKPWLDYAREQGIIKDDQAIVLLGLRREESNRRAGYPFACWSRENCKTIHPILDWTDRNVWDSINAHDVKVLHPGYGLGFERTGCFCCPNHSVGDWTRLREKRPSLFMRSIKYLAFAACNKRYAAMYASEFLIRMMGGKEKLLRPES